MRPSCRSLPPPSAPPSRSRRPRRLQWWSWSRRPRCPCQRPQLWSGRRRGRGTRRGGLRRVRWTRRPRHGTHEALRPSLHSTLAHLYQFPSRLREQRRRWGPGAAGVRCDRKREAGAAELGPLVQHGARCRCSRPLVTCPHPHPWASPAALHREEQGDQSHGLHHAGQQGLQEWKGARRGGGCKHRRAMGSSRPPPPNAWTHVYRRTQNDPAM